VLGRGSSLTKLGSGPSLSQHSSSSVQYGIPAIAFGLGSRGASLASGLGAAMSMLRISELLQDDEKKGTQARVVLTRTEPRRICGANSVFASLTGWATEEVAKRSLDVLHGPATNSSMLRDVIRSASEGGSESECCVVLYNKESVPNIHLVRFELCPSKAGEDELMTATFSPPMDLNPMEQVVNDLPMCKEARIIAHSNHPFLVTHVSQAWLDEFGCSEEDVRGGSLKTLDGTGTNGHLLLELMQSVKREFHFFPDMPTVS
jgi:hypothetical protein